MPVPKDEKQPVPLHDLTELLLRGERETKERFRG